MKNPGKGDQLPQDRPSTDFKELKTDREFYGHPADKEHRTRHQCLICGFRNKERITECALCGAPNWDGRYN